MRNSYSLISVCHSRCKKWKIAELVALIVVVNNQNQNQRNVAWFSNILLVPMILQPHILSCINCCCQLLTLEKSGQSSCLFLSNQTSPFVSDCHRVARHFHPAANQKGFFIYYSSEGQFINARGTWIWQPIWNPEYFLYFAQCKLVAHLELNEKLRNISLKVL